MGTDKKSQGPGTRFDTRSQNEGFVEDWNCLCFDSLFEKQQRSQKGQSKKMCCLTVFQCVAQEEVCYIQQVEAAICIICKRCKSRAELVLNVILEGPKEACDLL